MVAFCLKLTLYTYLVTSIVRALMLWDRFTCQKPVQAWLVCHQLVTLALCAGHQIANSIQPTGAALVLPVFGNRPQRAASLVVLAVLVPAFLVSDVIGLCWFLGYSGPRLACIPYDVVNDPQVVSLVLFGGCFWGVIYVIFGTSVLLRRWCPRARARDPVMDAERAPARCQLLNAATLQSLLAHHCPDAIGDQDCTAYCSICQEACLNGQKLRTIIVCGHQFHSDCLERWVRNRPVCPNCNQDVTTPIEV